MLKCSQQQSEHADCLCFNSFSENKLLDKLTFWPDRGTKGKAGTRKSILNGFLRNWMSSPWDEGLWLGLASQHLTIRFIRPVTPVRPAWHVISSRDGRSPCGIRKRTKLDMASTTEHGLTLSGTKFPNTLLSKHLKLCWMSDCLSTFTSLKQQTYKVIKAGKVTWINLMTVL